MNIEKLFHNKPYECKKDQEYKAQRKNDLQNHRQASICKSSKTNVIVNCEDR